MKCILVYVLKFLKIMVLVIKYKEKIIYKKIKIIIIVYVYKLYDMFFMVFFFVCKIVY